MADGGARGWYRDGVSDHYRQHGADYSNPHAPIIDLCVARALREWTIDASHVLDLAAGAGELTSALLKSEPTADVQGCDPYTGAAYRRQTRLPCEAIDFEQIGRGVLRGRRYSLVGCSFAMHLCPTSQLPGLLIELAQVAGQLLILSPHKRPVIRPDMGWSAIGEFVEQRVRTRLYRSNIL